MSMFGVQHRPYIVGKIPPLVEQIRENDDRGILKSAHSKLRTTATVDQGRAGLATVAQEKN